jgi:protoheme IX farnesyltransferase
MYTGADSTSEIQQARAKASDFLKLTKPGLTSLVLFTTLAGFYLGCKNTIPFSLLIHTLMGTTLVAAGTSALNMYMERKLDALMKRTSGRPLAAGRLKSMHALFFALATSLGGFVYLYIGVNPLTSLLAALILFSYLFLYTPLKKKTWLCTLAGAVPGALPIVMGWTGVTGKLSLKAGILFAIVFLWQFPHFYSIGWMHREDYARAGIPTLSVIDGNGRRTGRQTILSITILILFTLLPVGMGMAGSVYLVGAMALGTAFLAYGIQFSRMRDQPSAQRLFVASALYLPLLLILMTMNKTELPVSESRSAFATCDLKPATSDLKPDADNLHPSFKEEYRHIEMQFGIIIHTNEMSAQVGSNTVLRGTNIDHTVL